MFQFLKQRRQLRKIADDIGIELHRQIYQTLKARGTGLNTPDEIMFITGYLQGFIEYGFKDQDLPDLTKHIKYICNGVLPKRLWDFYQRGVAIYQISLELKRPEMRQAYEIFGRGYTVSKDEAALFFNEKVKPTKLAEFLLKV